MYCMYLSIIVMLVLIHVSGSNHNVFLTGFMLTLYPVSVTVTSGVTNVKGI